MRKKIIITAVCLMAFPVSASAEQVNVPTLTILESGQKGTIDEMSEDFWVLAFQSGIDETGAGTYTLQWEFAPENAEKFRISYALGDAEEAVAGTREITYGDLTTVDTESCEFTVDKLPQGGEYFFRVEALDKDGNVLATAFSSTIQSQKTSAVTAYGLPDGTELQISNIEIGTSDLVDILGIDVETSEDVLTLTQLKVVNEDGNEADFFEHPYCITYTTEGAFEVTSKVLYSDGTSSEADVNEADGIFTWMSSNANQYLICGNDFVSEVLLAPETEESSESNTTSETAEQSTEEITTAESEE